MNIDFKDMVKALAKDGAEIKQSLTPEKCHLLHMAIGVSGEASELLAADLDDIENIIEELGDIEFYLEGLCQGAAFTIASTPTGRTRRKNSIRKTLQVISGDILDTVKKHVIYNKAFPENDLLGLVLNLYAALQDAYKTFEVTRDQVIAHNIEKLGKRYAAGTYSDNAAQTRADKEGE